MSGKLVFVVDDDLSVRRGSRRLLEGRGYRVRLFDAVRPAQVELAGHGAESFDEDGLLRAVSAAVQPRTGRRPLN